MPESSWFLLGILVLGLLTLDVLLLRRAGPGSPRGHLLESALWIAAGLGFGFYVWAAGGQERALHYFTAYLVEKSLSADNLFVFAVLFESFHIRREHQHQVLFLGIFGALVLRLLFIFAGIALLERFAWVGLVFGAILVLTGLRMALRLARHTEEHPERNFLVRLAGRVLPLDPRYQGRAFWHRTPDGFRFTPMLLVLIAIESTDVLFAVDSVPAVLAVTHDRFIAYSSNAFAILGLRALYFVLADALHHLPLVRPALALMLVLIGVKMLVSEAVELPVWLPLVAVGALLAAAVGGSLWMRRGERRRAAPERTRDAA